MRHDQKRGWAKPKIQDAAQIRSLTAAAQEKQKKPSALALRRAILGRSDQTRGELHGDRPDKRRDPAPAQSADAARGQRADRWTTTGRVPGPTRRERVRNAGAPAWADGARRVPADSRQRAR